MDHRRVVFGIGNPGPDYAGTRHNVGFMALDLVAERMGITFRRLERKTPDGRRVFGGKVKGHLATGVSKTGASGDGEPFVLAKPLTYVNLSGDLAGPLLRVAELPAESLFVIVDDLDLPLGRMRCRPSGGSGGHNGLKSIGQALGSDGFPRLRLGIGLDAAVAGTPTGGVDAADFVLARFVPEEQEVLGVVLRRAADVICDWLDGVPLETLMGAHNGFDARLPSAPDAAPEPGGDRAEDRGTPGDKPV